MAKRSLRLKLFTGSILTAVIYSTLSADVTAQQSASVPDFSSNLVGWVTATGEFSAVPGEPRPTSNDPAHPRISNREAARTHKQPTYRIADLTNPNLKPWVVERMKKDNEEVFAGKIAFTARSHCMPAGVPGFLVYPLSAFFFLQTPKEVVMIFSGDQQVRHIYLDVPHSAHLKPSWYGESIGHYEGDTLVVDTIGLNDKTFLDNYRTPHTDKLHVIERWKLSDDGYSLEANVRVEDPDAFYQPWSGIVRYFLVRQEMQEEVCAEGNRQLFDYGIPVAEKPDF
ncbi:MAG TPA: hypothetical protein VH684_17900 [Xanthobacteraceae bacterium]|jgi:hypothetical protein